MKSSAVNNSGFTLVELVVSITILSVILISVFEAYSNIIDINRRLETMRILQENARSVTEAVASDVREKWIDLDYYDGSDAFKKNGYSGSGNTLLAIRWGTKYYPMKRDAVGNIVYCDDASMKSADSRCFLGMESPSGKRLAITQWNVRIEWVRFFISGDAKDTATNLSKEWKAQIVFSLSSELKGAPSAPATIRVQTTVSEKTYKKE